MHMMHNMVADFQILKEALRLPARSLRSTVCSASASEVCLGKKSQLHRRENASALKWSMDN
jgi:hypothetical protein